MTRVYDQLIEALDMALEEAQRLQPGREAALVRTKIDEALLWAGLLPERKVQEPPQREFWNCAFCSTRAISPSMTSCCGCGRLRVQDQGAT